MVFVNPVIIPEKTPWFPAELGRHTAGYFDDPDFHVEQGSTEVFTRFGFENLINGKTEERLVRQVQDAMRVNMADMLRLAALRR